jgi:uncharacterized membrane protein YwaF
MGLLNWLESTGYVQWMLTSLWAYPVMLTGHALGLALAVGVLLAVDLRLLGLYPTIPLVSIARLLAYAWAGIGLNAATGLMIFPTQATSYVSNVPFVVKMACVLLGSITLVATQRILKQDASRWDAAGKVPAIGRRLALGSMLFWTLAIVTGRLVAYV